jgi:uncharacterized protein (DUF1697 family)
MKQILSVEPLVMRPGHKHDPDADDLRHISHCRLSKTHGRVRLEQMPTPGFALDPRETAGVTPRSVEGNAVRYVALIRGINVGGNSIIPMTKLRAAFEACGVKNVSTFIASGNVLFEAPRGPKLEARLSEQLGLPIRLTLRTHAEMEAIVNNAPKGFGSKPDKFRYDVWFVIPPTTAENVVAALEPKEGVDAVLAGDGVVYATRLIARASQSRLTRVIGTPVYASVTIRSWNTTRKLGELTASRSSV